MSAVYRVAVIGAGAAGLCAARHLVHSKNFEAVVYEVTDHVGGTWFYTDEIGKDENGHPIHSSMYKDLNTNLPKQVMAFPDSPFDDSLPSFLHQRDVLQYLEDYCKKFSLQDHIKFNTIVDEVKPLSLRDGTTLPKWEVATYDWKTKLRTKSVFDGVMVCSGHYSVPNMPDIPGTEKFRGTMLHSHHFRKSESFSGQRVLLFGAKSSGIDIALHLSTVADRVILSHKGPNLVSKLPDNVVEASPICEVTETGVVCEDGGRVECDVIMFCTGYNYAYPFFKDDSIIQIVKNRITPLYKHLVHIHYPNLSIVGICRHICPFPEFHCQVLFAMAAMDGSMKLPSTMEMLTHQEDDYNRRKAAGLPNRGCHVLGADQWAYNDDLADSCRAERIPDNVMRLYMLTEVRRKACVTSYKKEEYELGEDGYYHLADA